MIVLDPDCGRATGVHIPALDATVADVNPAYPGDDRVVECIHEEWLERNAGHLWQGWNRSEFQEKLESYTGEWRIAPSTYDYPESRLAAVERREPERTDASGEGQSRLDEWAD